MDYACFRKTHKREFDVLPGGRNPGDCSNTFVTACKNVSVIKDKSEDLESSKDVL